MGKIKMGRDERRSLEDALSKIRSESGYAQSVDLNHLLNRWGKFVAEVEVGYSLSLPDYEKGLLVRDDLDNLIAALPPRLASTITTVVDPFDSRFKNATKPSRHLLPGLDSDGFWWSRVPRLVEGELREGLIADNLISGE